MVKVIGLIVLIYSTVIFGIIWLVRLVINKAIEKFVKPKLKERKLTFEDYKWLGVFDRGDFLKDDLVFIPSLKTGYPVTSIYIDVYFLDDSKKDKMTVRIDGTLWHIRNVFFSRTL
ncbi:MAG TPA: hypothetical protein VFE53_04985 [Mucilaginibacter sp.]|jgi:hypothetical protein|nr:hypothetical protein [Mucilaginibacter sp.]